MPTAPESHEPRRSASLTNRLFAPVDIAFLVYFRIVWGGTLIAHLVGDYFRGDMIRHYFLEPQFHFSFYGLEWLTPLPGIGMYVLFGLMAAAAACVLVGFLYRPAAIFLCAGLIYVFLLERVRTVNHDYLLCLLAFLMCFLPANRAGSIDAWLRKPLRAATAPAWTLWLLRLQVGIPYFYGGLAKLFDRDWLSTRATSAILGGTRHAVFQDPQTLKLAAAVLSYGGLVFDLAIVPMLLWRKTRALAIVLATMFHLSNAWLFDIEIFPWFMIPATLIFLSPSWPRKVGLGAILPPIDNAPQARTKHRRFTLACILLYAAVQLLFPLRYWFYSGNPNWTGEFQRFSWRMMLHAKRSDCRFVSVDPVTGESKIVDPGLFLTSTQYEFMRNDPDMMHQFARFLGAGLTAETGHPIEIRVQAQSSLNDRPYQWLIDRDVDLSRQPRSLWPQPWIVPLDRSRD